MSSTDIDLMANIREIVTDHYQKDSAPMLLSSLGLRLRKDSRWQPDRANGRTLLQLIEVAHDPDLVIVRDPNSPVDS